MAALRFCIRAAPPPRAPPCNWRWPQAKCFAAGCLCGSPRSLEVYNLSGCPADGGGCTGGPAQQADCVAAVERRGAAAGRARHEGAGHPTGDDRGGRLHAHPAPGGALHPDKGAGQWWHRTAVESVEAAAGRSCHAQGPPLAGAYLLLGQHFGLHLVASISQSLDTLKMRSSFSRPRNVMAATSTL